MNKGKNSGHGHVYPRPDGMRARCGGPAICSECARDKAQKENENNKKGKEINTGIAKVWSCYD